VQHRLVRGSVAQSQKEMGKPLPFARLTCKKS